MTVMVEKTRAAIEFAAHFATFFQSRVLFFTIILPVEDGKLAFAPGLCVNRTVVSRKGITIVAGFAFPTNG